MLPKRFILVLQKWLMSVLNTRLIIDSFEASKSIQECGCTHDPLRRIKASSNSRLVLPAHHWMFLNVTHTHTKERRGTSAKLPPVSFCHFAAFGRNIGWISPLTVSPPIPPLHCLPSIEVWITFKTTCSCVRATEPGSRQAGNVVTAEWDCSTWDGIDMSCSQTLSHALAAGKRWIWACGTLHNISSGTHPDLLGQVCPVQDGWQHPGVILTEEADRRERNAAANSNLLLGQVQSVALFFKRRAHLASERLPWRVSCRASEPASVWSRVRNLWRESLCVYTVQTGLPRCSIGELYPGE